MKKLILGVVFFAMSLQVGGGALYAVADQKGQAGDTSSYFDQFVQAVGNRAKATKKELSFLWGYLLKKYIYGEKTTQKEDERAKRIQKKLGIAIGTLVAIVAIIMGIKLYKNKKAIPLQTQTSAPTQLPVQTGKATNMPEEKDLTKAEDKKINKVPKKVPKSVNNKALNEGLNNGLFDAVQEGKIDEVQKLLSQGADVDARNQWGNTPLYIAVLRNDIQMAKLLITNGANKKEQDKDGNTLLHVAVKGVNIDLVNLFIAHGADNTMKNKQKQTPLDIAQIMEQDIVREIKVWYNGSNKIMRDLYQRQLNNNKIIKILSSPHLQPQPSAPTQLPVQTNNVPKSLEGLNNDLFKAVREGKIDEVQKLLSQGADVNARNEWRNTPLCIAANMGSIDTVRLLLGNKASVNAKCSFGGTALHGAVSCLNVNNVDTVKLLLRSGADKNIQSNDGNTPLDIAKRMKNLSALSSKMKENLSVIIEILSLSE